MKKHTLLLFCTVFFLYFGIFDIKCRAAVITEEDFGGETEGKEEKMAGPEDISEELNRLWNENYMQECLDYRTLLEYGTIFIKLTRKPAGKVY